MACARLFYPEINHFGTLGDKIFYRKKNNQQCQKQELFFSEMLFEKDCAMSSLDYLIYEDTKLDESKENEKIKQISETIFLVSTRSDYLELNWEKDSTKIINLFLV